ncbi:hypothetical protein F5Y12DRAFT_442229 [Xylaria sp. FL1777]|nr:hypothetical protein F5Y12DRAFT_442229 [Xylaria sp. FL1777]
MWSWSLSSTAMVLFYASTIAGLDQRGDQASPIETGKPSVEARALHPRTDITSTSTSRQPTTSTPYAVPLTTTFIPPDSCNQAQLTQLSSPGFFIWLNEPVPVPGTTVSDCYPSEFLQYYKTYTLNPTTLGSMVPLMSPLVYPLGWQVVNSIGNYVALCPIGYGFTSPKTTLDPNRPAYGGTCYSQWPLSSSAYVKVFGSASSSGFMLITASTLGFANYAHVIDGIVVSTVPPTTSTSSSSSSTSATVSAQLGDSEHTSLTRGAIAGIVVGVIVAVGLLVAAFYLYARRRRQILRQMPPALPPKDEGTFTTTNKLISAEKPPDSPVQVKQTRTNLSEMEGEVYVHELEAGQLPVENS